MREKFIKNQQEYWDEQHKKEPRASEVEGGPNEFARNYMHYVKPGGRVLEIGVASGNDARYFVKENKNTVIGVDISQEAIKRFIGAATKDGIVDRVVPIVANAAEIPLLLSDQEYFDTFYSRSALHLDDDKAIPFLQWIVSHLNEDGVIMIEGKTKDDFKVGRSTEVGKNLFEDINGHVRRVWSEDDIKSMCELLNMEIVEMGRTVESILGKETSFIHFIAKKSKVSPATKKE